MRYIGPLRWRTPLIPIAILLMLPLSAVQMLTFGTVRGVRAWLDFMDWCFYER